MKKLFFSFFLIAAASTAVAQVNVTESYIGDLSAVVNGGGHNHNASNHNKNNGIGWYNTQTLAEGWHAFVAPGTSGTGESWTPGIGTAGVMMGRTMVLPAGNYTLSYQAFGTTADNAANKTAPAAGDVVAFCTGQGDVDITNTTLGGNTFHNVSFTFDVTTPNTVFEFGIKKTSDASPAEWCQIKGVSLVLNSTNIIPIANNSVDGWTRTPAAPAVGGFEVNTWSTEGQGDGTSFLVPFVQSWASRGNSLSNVVISRSYTPAQNGVYKVTAWVRALNESGGAVSGAKIFVGDVEADACGGTPITNGTLGTYTAMADGVAGTPFDFGFKIEGATFNWISFKNITIEYAGAGLPDADIDALIATVPSGKMDATVRQNLDNLVSALQTNKSVAAYNALVVYISTANASVNAYAEASALAEANKAKAEGAGFNVDAAYADFANKYKNGLLNGNTEAVAIRTAYETALCAAIADVKANYPNSSNDVLNTDLSRWETSTYVANNADEHWSGVKPTLYYEQTSAQWGQNSWSIAAQQTVSLPAGHYAFVVTARASEPVTSTLTVGDKTVKLSTEGSVGFGIAKDGTATYASTAEYARTGGFGWEYSVIKFELTEPQDIKFRFASSSSTLHTWVSIANPVLYYQNDAKEAMEALIAATYYEREVTSGNFGTICLPKAVAVADRSGATFYNVAGVVKAGGVITDVVLEEETGALVAGKPYVFKATASKITARFNGEAVADAVSATGLVGTLAAEGITLTTEGKYILSGNKLRKLAGGTATVAKNRAYFDLDAVADYVPAASSESQHIFVEVEEEGNATSLSNLETESNTEIYDLMGRRVEKVTKGIFFVGGKKVVVK